MAVVYPCEDDQRALATFTEFFVQQPTVNSLFRVNVHDVDTLTNACQSILGHLERVTRLFLTSTPLNVEDVPQAQVVQDAGTLAYETGSVYPHLTGNNTLVPYGIVLSESAGMAPPLLQNPKGYLRPQLDALNVMVAELDSSKAMLQSINVAYAYLWTTDVEALRQYVAQDEKRQRMQKPMWERTNMKTVIPTEALAPAPPHQLAAEPVSVDVASVAPRGAGGALGDGGGQSEGETSAPSIALPTYRTLLALDPTQLPSAQVQRSFAKFIQACDSLMEWAGSVLGLLSGKDDVPKAGTYEIPPSNNSSQRRDNQTPTSGEKRPAETNGTTTRRPATKTVRIHRYEIRDVSHIYDMYYQQAECFFLPQYALFDARIHQRLLQPAYFYALRILMEDMTTEMERLQHIAASRTSLVRADTRLSPYDAFQHGAYAGGLPEAYGVGVPASGSSPHTWATGDNEEPPKIVFRPTVPQFGFLRNTLRLLLSICLNEDDRTSFKRYEEMYETLVTNARDAVAELHHMPKPPSLSQKPGAGERPGRATAAGSSRRELVLVARESTMREALPPNKVAWAITAEDRGRLRGCFETYSDLRGSVRSLKLALDKDIKRKDETHRTRVLEVCVAEEKDPVTIMAIERQRERQEAVLRERRESSGFLGAARASLRSLAGTATCKAEVQMEDLGIPSTPQRDDEGVDMTTTSPYHAEKVLLQASVNRLWNAVEAHGIHMEREYPGLFYRGEKQRWAQRLDSLVGKANAMSVVFSP
ncbi:hypothetical protein ABB37_06696 [Leptomonas pyrrhocoris]|uniref:Uncharacterized protein n=1 Tax=Leptomonas pyrrhocoris TaxID=157538 RepID=A0A0M9FXF4_LEPPY|nr:hypothetical protein ABB37_06696 [Leptomonas pyrrhocoris]KPA77917.1 hypothetical protein ABB37_06696 [Leptomonas pyrrhocoris]|eukprot:XP_015656356.1 hypothetical protein ABB37_06696 [Leptomonas pyrrhocoris]